MPLHLLSTSKQVSRRAKKTNIIALEGEGQQKLNHISALGVCEMGK